MKVAVTGASGLVGSALVSSLEADGHEVIRLVRRPAQGPGERQWNPNGEPDPSLVDGADAVVHLAAETISGWWTQRKKDRILNSRVRGTENIATAIAKAQNKPKVFISASGTGYYGHRKDEVMTEASSAGMGFLADLARQWEQKTNNASSAGVRVVILRMSVVLSMRGGALLQLLPSFKMGLGGKIGNGKQYWPWVTLDDVVGVIRFAIEHQSLSGPVNVCSPQETTNRQFTKAMGRVLRKPTFFPLPSVVVTLTLGEMGQEALLTSTRAVPAKLQQAGYQFKHPNIEEALKAVFSESRGRI